mmetsp:Transcript_97647/g.273220  ORF Transcript_97647/g.273220 Transcript_97647/m.273220 type:complete len:658 (+) Transcript_97647:93-2066(+)
MGGCGTKSQNADLAGSRGSSTGSKPGSPQANKAPVKQASTTNADKPILGRYKLLSGKEDVMGKGTSSICRRGKDLKTGKLVAIKVYKEQSTGGKVKDTTMQKYRRQIAVLKELQEPFKVPSDPKLWHETLNTVKPSQLFMQLLDYSKDATGEPGPDVEDGMLYVVTELAQYSLKDFLADRREKQKPLSKEAVRDLTKRIMLAMAGLHAKGFVHIDMKPENLMVFDGRLKVIDVDGCVRTNTNVSINDGSISFSPCYCAPEWARFIIKDSTIQATPGLDVWSVGMTVCEFITLDAIWKVQYANFMRNAQSHREAGFLFLEWLGDIKTPPMPKAVETFDKGLVDLLFNWLLVTNPSARKSCAQALSNPYLAEGGWAKYGDQNKLAVEQAPARRERDRRNDESTGAPVHKGTLYKLNTNSDPKDPANWIRRDMWLAQNFSLCYYSVKENKRLVLIDGEQLSKSQVNKVSGQGRDFAFEVVTNDEESAKTLLAAEDADELAAWEEKLVKVAGVGMTATFKLGAKMAEDIQAFKLAVRNRRMKLEGDRDGFEPVHKDQLWKLKTGGDRSVEEHWFRRDMWIAKNGSMVYYSPKEERELVYYTAADINRATVKKAPDGHGCKRFVFTVQLPATDGVEFEPGEFSAETEEHRTRFMQALQKFMA